MVTETSRCKNLISIKKYEIPTFVGSEHGKNHNDI